MNPTFEQSFMPIGLFQPLEQWVLRNCVKSPGKDNIQERAHDLRFWMGKKGPQGGLIRAAARVLYTPRVYLSHVLDFILKNVL